MSELICNNCGLKGHVYKDCKAPITSYGNIIYKQIDGIPYILMIQRKDSLCYIEFLRGKYDIYNIAYIQILFDKFSIEEKENILQYDYEDLWRQLWLIQNIEINRFTIDYEKGKSKFNKLKKGFHFHKLNVQIDLNYFLTRSTTAYKTSEWEFPKGRRNNGESNKECAIREFREETNYENSDYELLTNLSPLSEQYLGENKVRYKHIYYVGYLTNLEKEVSVDPNNSEQVSEIKQIQWVTKEEALKNIRDYHSTRRKVIHTIFKFIDELDNYIII